MTALILTILVLVLLMALLLVRWHIVVFWRGRVVELQLGFFGLTKSIWRRDILAGESREREDKEHLETEPRDRLYFDLIDQLVAIVDHRDAIIETAQALLRLIRKFGGWWRLDHATAEIAQGTGDPARTGMVHGAVSALGGLINAAWPQVRLISHANFDRVFFDTRGEVHLSFRLWDPLRDAFVAALTIPWRRLWKLRRQVVYQ